MTDTETWEPYELDREYPCWHCGQHHVSTTICEMEYERNTVKIECPSCGKIYEFCNCDRKTILENILKKVLLVPKDPERRAEYYAEWHFLDSCERNDGKEIWSFEGTDTCYGSDFYIKPTSCDGKKTFYIGCNGDEYGGYMSFENAKALRDALNKWLGEE